MEALGASPASEERGPGKRNKGWGECSALTLLLELKSEGKIQINRLSDCVHLLWASVDSLPCPPPGTVHRPPPSGRLWSLLSGTTQAPPPRRSSESIFSLALIRLEVCLGLCSGTRPPPLVCLPSQTLVSVPSSPLGSTWCQSSRKRVLSCPRTPGLTKNKEQSTSQYVLSNNFFVFNIN